MGGDQRGVIKYLRHIPKARPMVGLLCALMTVITACQTTDEARPEILEDGAVRLYIPQLDVWKVRLTGETMGTTWSATYLDEEGRSFMGLVDSVLEKVNAQFSTWDHNSAISQFNAGNGLSLDPNSWEADWWQSLLEVCDSVYVASGGRFDPTVAPLVELWGFFRENPFTMKVPPAYEEILAVLPMVGFNQLRWDFTALPDSLRLIASTKAKLDFSAVAKGQAVDLIAFELKRALAVVELDSIQIGSVWLPVESRDLEAVRCLVEVGGEVVAQGMSETGEAWKIALEKPVVGRRELQEVVYLDGAAMATSGNYRRFWVYEGRSYGHTLNPETGQPEITDLLSASVITNSCAYADAYATAFMVMGTMPALQLAESIDGLEAHLITLDPDTEELISVQTSGFSQYLKSE